MTEKYSGYKFSNKKVNYVTDEDVILHNSGLGYIHKSNMIDESIREGELLILKLEGGYVPVHVSQVYKVFKDYELLDDDTYTLKELCKLLLIGLAKEFKIGPYVMTDLIDIDLYGSSVMRMVERFYARQN